MSRKLALVTGASSGIGRSLAEEFAARGYDLIINSASEQLDIAAVDLRKSGLDILVVRADLATANGVRQLWEQISPLGRQIYVACINAGVGVGGLFVETDLDAELNMVNLNCVGTLQLSKYIVRDMVARGEAKSSSRHLSLERWSRHAKPSTRQPRHSSCHSRTASDTNSKTRESL
jgi:short-subunit dehydrogenase